MCALGGLVIELSANTPLRDIRQRCLTTMVLDAFFVLMDLLFHFVERAVEGRRNVVA